MTLQGKRFGIIAGIVILAIAALTGWAVFQKTNNSSKPKSDQNMSGALSTSQPMIKGQHIQQSSYYAISLINTDPSAIKQYYGKVQQVGSAYVRLYPAYYMDSANKLVRLGKELHMPEPVMYIQTTKISAIAKLTANNAQLQAIQAFEKATPVPAVHDASPASDINQYIKPAEYQAVFFDSGKVFFGKLKSITGGQLFANNSQVFGLEQSGNQVTLGKIPLSEVANYNSSQIIFWENLVSSGQVSQAITTYSKQNP